MTNSDHDQGGGRQLLIGLDAIARVAGVSAQVAWRLIESGDLPVHKIGIGSGTICATPTAIRRWRAARRARVSGWRQTLGLSTRAASASRAAAPALFRFHSNVS